MKRFLLLLLLLFPVYGFSQKGAFSLGEFVYTVPVSPLTGTDDGVTEWWHEYFDPSLRHDFFQPLLDLVDSGRVTAFYPEAPFRQPMEPGEAKWRLHSVDTVEYSSGYYYYENEYYLLRHDITAEMIQSVSFHEEWMYDSIAKTLHKQVKGIILNITQESDDENEPNFFPLFYIPFNGKIINGAPAILPVKNFTYTLHTHDFGGNAFSSDALFFGDSLLQQKETAAAKLIARSIATGKKTIFYDTIYPYTEPLDKKTAQKRKAGFQSANGLRFLEDWTMDLQQMTFTKNVRGVVLQQSKTTADENRTHLSYMRLAFVPLNGNIPSAEIFPQRAVTRHTVYRSVFFPVSDVWESPNVTADSAKLMSLCTGLCNVSQQHVVPVYSAGDPWQAGRQPLAQARADSLFTYAVQYSMDSTWESWGNLSMKNVGGLGFYEEWYFDPAKNTFRKNVRSVSLLSKEFYGLQEKFLLFPYFNIDPPADTAAIRKPEFLLARHVQTSVRIDNQFSDYSGTERQPNALPGENSSTLPERYRFVQLLITDALAGKITVYDGEQTSNVLTPAQLRTKLDAQKDSSFSKTDLPNDYLLVNQLIFDEDWYFNPATGQLYKKVNAVIFVYHQPETYDAEWNPITHDTKLFAIKIN